MLGIMKGSYQDIFCCVNCRGIRIIQDEPDFLRGLASSITFEGKRVSINEALSTVYDFKSIGQEDDEDEEKPDLFVCKSCHDILEPLYKSCLELQFIETKVNSGIKELRCRRGSHSFLAVKLKESSNKLNNDVDVIEDKEHNHQMQEIVTEIMKFMSRDDLFSCRRVCRQWAIVLSSILMRRKVHDDQYPLAFESVSKNSYGIEFSPDDGNCWSLEELNGLLSIKKSWDFPCAKFSLRGSLDSTEVQTFLSIQGQILKNCCLDLYDVDVVSINFENQEETESARGVGVTKLRNFLLEDAPYLSSLSLRSLPEGWSNVQNFLKSSSSGQANLPNLKLLTIRNHVPLNIIRDIIGASIYLNEIYLPWNSSAFFADFLRQNTWLKLVKGFSFTPQSDNWRLYCQFSEKITNLKSVYFDFVEIYSISESWSVITRIVNHIFDSSRETLEKIHRLPPLSFLTDIKRLPRLPHVKELYLSSDNEGDTWSSSFLPESQPWSQVFPNLEYVNADLYMSDDNESLLLDSFDGHSMATVKSLIIPWGTPPMMERLCSFCPNLRTLQLDIFELVGLVECCPHIFTTLFQLEALKLCSSYAYFDNFDICAEMDSALTGIPADICKTLRKQKLYEMSDTKWFLQTFQKSPSLLSLPYLKHFTLKLDVNFVDIAGPCISEVTGLFAFRPMKNRQQLGITIEVKKPLEIQKMVSPGLLEYVDRVKPSRIPTF